MQDGQDEDPGGTEEVGENNQNPQVWTYDKIAANPHMAAAFRAFANRALCQESVWFLEEVSRCGRVCTVGHPDIVSNSSLPNIP